VRALKMSASDRFDLADPAELMDLGDLCERMRREASAHVIAVLGEEGQLLGHAGPLGRLAEPVVERIADLAVDLHVAGDRPDVSGAERIEPVEGMHLCATAVGRKATLAMLFTTGANLTGVRLRLRRLRDLLARRLA
jgi:hypothetical protein